MDAQSTGSVSASNRKINCPFCNEEFQNRAIFNHIQKKHVREFVDLIFIDTVEELEKHIDHAFGLPLMWNIKNDFDEMEPVEIHGCLACGTGIPSKGNACGHCGKEKCRAKHVAGLKSLMNAVKRKEKAKQEHEAKRNPANWTDDSVEAELKICLRRYKYIAPHVERLVAAYNAFLRKCNDTSKQPCTWAPEPVPSVIDKSNVRTDYYKWLRINGDLDAMIAPLREAQFYNMDFNYDLWVARTAENPNSIFVTVGSMHLQENIDIYPQL
jgi:hypothetical protein